MSASSARGRIPIPIRALRLGPSSFRYHRRSMLVGTILLAATLLVALISLMLGDFVLTAPEVISALLGNEHGIIDTIVREWRLPRMLAALVFGAALGVSGAIFQSLTRNPLASPDIIGMSSGAYVGALFVLAFLGGGTFAVAGGATAGGLLAAAVIYVLSYRRGIQGFRLIIVGIAISAMLGSISSYLILRSQLQTAMAAAVWGAGTLGEIGWSQLLPTTVVVVLALVLTWIFSPAMRQLELGDDAAAALGVATEQGRLVLMVAGVALIAVVTAFAGPIPFVALAAPQIARRLAGAAGTTLVGAALTGALLLIASDVVAQHLAPKPLPVGVVTVVIGGAYLAWLLINEARRRP